MSFLEQHAASYRGVAKNWQQSHFRTRYQYPGEVCTAAAARWVLCRTRNLDFSLVGGSLLGWSKLTKLMERLELAGEDWDVALDRYMDRRGLANRLCLEFRGRAGVSAMLVQSTDYCFLKLYNPEMTVGHCLAIDMQRYAFFDPNDGEVSFSCRNDLIAFILHWLRIRYPALCGPVVISRCETA